MEASSIQPTGAVTVTGNGLAEPPWAHKPQHEWSLVEIKDGVEIAVHTLKRASTVLGRAADLVDIPLSHESASRYHARIAFDRSGTPLLRDLRSTHGVTINKKRFPSAAIGQDESNGTKPGARGVVIYPGDVLQFGASTRIYCLEGPEEWARGAIAVRKPKPVEDEDRQEESVSMLMLPTDDSDTDETETRSERQSRPLTDECIPEQHLKEWEKLKALQYKLDNVNTESERIRVKVDLTAGQERQLQRNDERAKQLQEQISIRETDLHKKTYPHAKPRPGRNGGGVAHSDVDDDDDDDDYFDRTKTAISDDIQVEFSKDGESEKSLLIKWNTLQEQKGGLVVEMDMKHHQLLLLERKVSKMNADADSEAFFVQNELNITKETYDKLQAKIKALDGVLHTTNHLITVVNPNLRLIEGVWTSKRKKPCALSQQENSSNGTKRMTSTAVEPLISMEPTGSDESQRTDDMSCTPSPSPQPKKRRPSSPSVSMPPPILSIRRKHASTTATVAMLFPTAPQRVPVDSQTIGTGALPAATASDAKVDVWKAPKDQDGSGNTKLNAKFAGRY